jgi:hypothetical protein
MLSSRRSKFFSSLKHVILVNSIYFSRPLKPKPSFIKCIYGAAGQTKMITLKCIREKYEKGLALTAVTAYDYSSAIHVIFFQSS